MINEKPIHAEWKRAIKAFVASIYLVKINLPEDAISRSYYSVMHAAKASLLSEGIITESHKGIIQMFGQHLIHTGKIEKEWSKILSHEFLQRGFADYNTEFEPTLDSALDLVNDARSFIQRMKEFLTSKGIILSEDIP